MTKERFFVLKESKRNDDLYSEFNVVDEKTGEDLEAVCLSVMDPSSINGERFTKCNGFVGFLHSYTHKECPFCIASRCRKENNKEYVTLSFIKH